MDVRRTDGSAVVTVGRDGVLAVEARDAAEAKAALAALRDERRRLGVLRKRIEAEAREVRAAHRPSNGVYATARDRGGAGRAEAATALAADRQRLAAALAPHLAAREETERALAAVAAAIRDLTPRAAGGR